jgi:hypothetical protein
MLLTHHGGKCCGVKTVFNLSGTPNAMLSALKEDKSIEALDGGINGIGQRWIKKARPMERAWQRLDWYISEYKKKRKSGILELVIQTPSKPELYNWGQAHWISYLLDRGFVEVNAHLNSNSGNICRQFVLNIGKPFKTQPIIPATEFFDKYKALPKPPELIIAADKEPRNSEVS